MMRLSNIISSSYNDTGAIAKAIPSTLNKTTMITTTITSTINHQRIFPGSPDISLV